MPCPDLTPHNHTTTEGRGKFGLGSKMALIWSKKSTGLPIEIQSAHTTDPGRNPSHVSRCILDIDINRNQPQVSLVGERACLLGCGGWPAE